MIHNDVRRLEGDPNLGHWGVGTNGNEVLAQVKSASPDCDQERILLSVNSALSLAITMKEVAMGERTTIQKIGVMKGSIDLEHRDGMIHVTMAGGACSIGGSQVEAVMADYDALEFAEALAGQAFDLLVREKGVRNARFEGSRRPA